MTVWQFLLIRATVLILERFFVAGRFVVFAVQMVELLVFGFFSFRFLVLDIIDPAVSGLIAINVVYLKRLGRLVTHLLAQKKAIKFLIFSSYNM